MCNRRLAGSPELWITDVPESRGAEADYAMWEEAEAFFDKLYSVHEAHANDAVITALGDVYNRCIEERRRAGDLMALHDKWSRRRIGGVEEPESAVRE